MAGLVPAIHVLLAGETARESVDARHIRAFTPVFDGLWPGMTKLCYFAAVTMISSL
jgi:hypothetical protein